MGFKSQERQQTLSTPKSPDQVWDPPSLHSMGPRVSLPSPGVKWLIHEGNHLPPSCAKVKSGGAILPLSQHAFMPCRGTSSLTHWCHYIVTCQDMFHSLVSSSCMVQTIEKSWHSVKQGHPCVLWKLMVHKSPSYTLPSQPGPPHLWDSNVTLTRNTNNRQISMTLVEFELAIPESERLLTHALYHAAIGIGCPYHLLQLHMVQIIPVHNFTCYFFKIHFHFILLSLTGLQVVCSLCIIALKQMAINRC